MGDASPKRPGTEAAAVELIKADDFLPGECLGAAELVFEIGQLGGGDGERGALKLELRAQVAVVDFEERIPGHHALAGTDENSLDDAGDVRADGNVFGAGLDESDSGDALGKWRLWRRGGRLSQLALGQVPHHRSSR